MLTWKRLVIGSVITALAVSSFIPAFAEQYNPKKEQQMMEELKRIRQEKKEAQQEKKATEREVKSLAQKVVAAKSQIDRLESEIETQERRLAEAQEQLAVAEEDMVRVTQELGEQIQLLNSRLRQIYTAGDVTYIEVLMGSQSFSDFLDRFEYMKLIVEQDKQLVETIELRQAEIEKHKQVLEARRQEIQSIKLAAEDKQRETINKKNEHSKLMDQANSDLDQYADEIEKLEEAESKKVAEVIKYRQLKPAEAKGQGEFLWPVPDSKRVTSPYGWRTHPIFKNRRFHRGVDIGAPTNTNIVAVQDGEVIFSGWMSGYGNVSIIDHGAKMSTLYAHQHKLLVKVGDNVKKGEVIGKVGSTGNSTGPHLHFEVRKNGEPTDPMPYIR